MFDDALAGRSKLYAQMPDLRAADAYAGMAEEDGTVLLQCSLLSEQMLSYDSMMFAAIREEEDNSEALKIYRPYLFSYVAEVDRGQYERLRKLQEESEDISEDPAPYVWLPCTFRPEQGGSYIELSGYVVRSASYIHKIRENLFILEDEKTPSAKKKKILDGYAMDDAWLKDDTFFIDKLKKHLGSQPLTEIEIYKIGNGNCVFAQGQSGSFFYDIGFNCRHRPGLIGTNKSYVYKNTMNKVRGRKPSFFILSHWDMDHIAGCFYAGKGFLDKDWFAPDCDDARADAKRLAKYLGLKNHLYLVERPTVNPIRNLKQNKHSARLIGEINIPDATYKLYMGKKMPCDSSLPNCEGIVIEYTDVKNDKCVLMMGDVNYASFNAARRAEGEPDFADAKIDYLIAPHHGSEHTEYQLITDHRKNTKKDRAQAVICCTAEENSNRPNREHREELEIRFDKVLTTENDVPKSSYGIKICL